MPVTREDLARLALATLKKQREYFNPRTRTQDVLRESKALEQQLKHEAEMILEGPTLFGED
jgi:hypothetical protein